MRPLAPAHMARLLVLATAVAAAVAAAAPPAPPAAAAVAALEWDGRPVSSIDVVQPEARNDTQVDCGAIERARDAVVDLFRRPLTRREYEDRNFNWLRCTSAYSNRWDVGGLWAGPWGRDLLRHLRKRRLLVIGWHYRYIHGRKQPHGEWGDAKMEAATLLFDPLPSMVELIKEFALKAAVKHRRSVYFIDCPVKGVDNGIIQGWERHSIRFPNIIQDYAYNSNPELTIAYYKVGAFEFWPANVTGDPSEEKEVERPR